MSVFVAGFDGNNFDQRSIEGIQDRFIKTHYRLNLSGNYPTGGDTLDFTNGGVNSAVPNLGRGIESIVEKSMGASTSTFAGAGGYLTFLGVPGPVGAAGVTALNAWKVKFLAPAGTEEGAGAYSGFANNPLTDVIEIEVTWFLG